MVKPSRSTDERSNDRKVSSYPKAPLWLVVRSRGSVEVLLTPIHSQSRISTQTQTQTHTHTDRTNASPHHIFVRTRPRSKISRFSFTSSFILHSIVNYFIQNYFPSSSDPRSIRIYLENSKLINTFA